VAAVHARKRCPTIVIVVAPDTEVAAWAMEPIDIGLQALLSALDRFDREHAAVYFQIVYDALREPMQRALEALIMERHAEAKSNYPAFAQKLIDLGELKGTRDVLLRLIARAGITLSDDDLARVNACKDLAQLDRWVDNVLGAKTAADVLT
jgi:hypothetical protein